MSLPLDQRLVFAHVFEGLFLRALKLQVTPRLIERLRKECGVDLGKPFDPAYPVTVWTKCLQVTASELFPGVPEEVALENIGSVLTRGYFDTVIGSALAAMLRVLGPARALRRMDRSLRSGNNYAECRAEQVAPTRFSLWVNETGVLRHNLVGLLRTGAEVAGAKNCRCRIASFDDASVTIDLEWDA